MKLITDAQAIDQLNLDFTDALIGERVEVASAVVLDYLKQTGPRSEFQTLPTPDPVTGLVTWPYTWPSDGAIPTWWPAQRVSYQNVAPYIALGWVDSNGDPLDVPGPVQVATRLVLAALFDDREGAGDPISPAVESLLRRYRDPAMA